MITMPVYYCRGGMQVTGWYDTIACDKCLSIEHLLSATGIGDDEVFFSG